jgi:hypothetical protein
MKDKARQTRRWQTVWGFQPSRKGSTGAPSTERGTQRKEHGEGNTKKGARRGEHKERSTERGTQRKEDGEGSA